MNIAPVNFQSKRYKSNYNQNFSPKIKTNKKEFDKLVKQVSSDPQNPCYNNISNFINSIPKTKANIESLSCYYNNEITYDEFLKEISYNNLCDSMRTCFETRQQTQQKAKIVQQEFEQGTVDASNFEMVLDLIENKELNPDVFIGIDKRACFSDAFIEDLNKLYSLKTEGGV